MVEFIQRSTVDVGHGLSMGLCQRILDEKGMLSNWAMSVAFPIFKGKGNIFDGELSVEANAC